VHLNGDNEHGPAAELCANSALADASSLPDGDKGRNRCRPDDRCEHGPDRPQLVQAHVVGKVALNPTEGPFKHPRAERNEWCPVHERVVAHIHAAERQGADDQVSEIPEDKEENVELQHANSEAPIPPPAACQDQPRAREEKRQRHGKLREPHKYGVCNQLHSKVRHRVAARRLVERVGVAAEPQQSTP